MQPSPSARPVHLCLCEQVLTENNVKALRESVQTLTKTLQHIERITGAGCCPGQRQA